MVLGEEEGEVVVVVVEVGETQGQEEEMVVGPRIQLEAVEVVEAVEVIVAVEVKEAVRMT